MNLQLVTIIKCGTTAQYFLQTVSMRYPITVTLSQQVVLQLEFYRMVDNTALQSTESFRSAFFLVYFIL